MRLTDAQIAYAMELKYGVGLCWKTIAQKFGMNRDYLKAEICLAKQRGMRRHTRGAQ